MADIKIPLTFQIYKGTQLVRSENLVLIDQIRIGKVSSAHLKLDEEGVSRMHAEISLGPGEQIILTDLGSQKGTFVNGQKVPKHNLRSGDEIRIGDARLVLTIGKPISTVVAAAPAATAAATAAPRVSAPRIVLPPIDLSQVEHPGVLNAEVQMVFQGAPVQVLNLKPIRRIWVGDAPECDFFAPKETLGRDKQPLLWTAQESADPMQGPQNFAFCFSQGMKGEVSFDEGKSATLADLIASGEASALSGVPGVYALPLTRPARCRMEVSPGFSLIVKAVPAPKKPIVASKPDLPIIAYTAVSIVAHTLLLLLIFSISPDARSLDLSQLDTSNQHVKFVVKPPEQKEEKVPSWLKNDQKDEQGGKGKKHAGDEGKMGKKNSPNKAGLYAMKGPPNNPDPHLARQKAEEAAINAGIVGLIKGGGSQGSPFASVFGRDDAVGSDAENVLGGLYGDRIGEAEGGFGLGLKGTGIGGGGTGEGTIGLGSDNTVGKGGGGGNGAGYGRGVGNIGNRTAGGPEVSEGKADIRGSLDKEIIRRVIKRAMPGIKFCYETALKSNPELGGKVKIKFVIAPNGAVSTAFPESGIDSTVDSCVAGKIKQLSFPAPQGGGIVEVSYPFIFQSAGGGN